MYLPIEIDSHRGGIKDVPNHLAEANPFRNNGTLWNIQHKKGCRFATNPYISILQTIENHKKWCPIHE
jgi:hypothetical protein